MKPASENNLLSFRTVFVLIISLLLYIQAGCESSKDFSDSKSNLDTGTISFDVVWNQRSDIDTDYQARAVICGSDPAQVATISVSIVNTET